MHRVLAYTQALEEALVFLAIFFVMIWLLVSG
jgi:hypothetical protein